MRRLVTLSLTASALAAASAMAQDGTPVGIWKTIDDASGKPKSLVRITENRRTDAGPHPDLAAAGVISAKSTKKAP